MCVLLKFYNYNYWHKQEYQHQLDMEAFMEVMDQQENLNQEYVRRHNEQEEWEAQLENLNADVEHNPAAELPTQQSVVGNQTLDELPTQQSVVGNQTLDEKARSDGEGKSADDEKGKQIADVPVEEKASEVITPKKRNNQKWMEMYHTKDGQRIYHKNRGRSERIKNIQMSRAYNFDQFGTGSVPDNAFDVSDSD